jgi:hypothetical protein
VTGPGWSLRVERAWGRLRAVRGGLQQRLGGRRREGSGEGADSSGPFLAAVAGFDGIVLCDSRTISTVNARMRFGKLSLYEDLGH